MNVTLTRYIFNLGQNNKCELLSLMIIRFTNETSVKGHFCFCHLQKRNVNKDTETASEWRNEIGRGRQTDTELSRYLQANFAQPVL